MTDYTLFFKSPIHHRDLHSFPTRRSSDLVEGTMPKAYTGNPIFCKYAVSRTPPSITAPEKLREYIAVPIRPPIPARSEEHTSELQSHSDLVCRLLLEKKNTRTKMLICSTP